MNVLDLANEMGLLPKRTASTKGGEYHSGCPDSDCGGENRFCIWPKEGENGRYWCRRCERSGDAIEFCKEFIGMSFTDACKKVGKSISINHRQFPKFNRESFIPVPLKQPSEIWQKKAIEFVLQSHKNLCHEPHLINLDKNRGISLKTIQECMLGWNHDDSFQLKADWGLEFNGSGSKSICLPKGIVIPCSRDNVLLRVKVRRSNWVDGDQFPKYQIIAGGITCPSIYGGADKPIILVEAELDAAHVQQIAGDLCSCIALGGASNKPDSVFHDILKKINRILFSLDFDEAGKKHFQFWKSTYNKLKAWPVPKGKSPGDAFLLGVDLRKWVIAGLKIE